MIEEDISYLEERIAKIEGRFDSLLTALRAAFGDDCAANELALRSQVESYKLEYEKWRKSISENGLLLVDLARILGMKNNAITADGLKRAASKAMGK